MSGHPSWSEEREQEFVELWEQGVPTRVIGRRMGVSAPSVCNRARRMGLTPRATGRAGGPSWDDDDPIIIRLVNEGRDNAEIAKRVGRSVAAIECRKVRLRKAGKLPKVRKPKAAPHAKPPVVFDRKTRKCLHCREPFASEHRGNWICKQCAPIVNRAQSAIA